MRTLVMVVVLLVAVLGEGCRKRVPVRYEVSVPPTPDGLACVRQCMVVLSACQGGRGQNYSVCKEREDDCLRTCPGAVTLADGAPVVVPPPEAPPAPLAVPAGQSCVASQLPEWKGSSAAEKKALLERCRAPPAPAAAP